MKGVVKMPLWSPVHFKHSQMMDAITWQCVLICRKPLEPERGSFHEKQDGLSSRRA